MHSFAFGHGGKQQTLREFWRMSRDGERAHSKSGFESFIEINFIEEPEFVSVFDGNLDADTICSVISAIRPDARFIPGTMKWR